MGRPKKEKQVRMVTEEFLSPSDNKDRKPNREIELAVRDLHKTTNEAMRLFRRQYRLPHMYNDGKDN